jgi:hypothetical protein
MRIDGQLINAGTEKVDVLPTSNLFYGRMVILSTDNTLYHYIGGAWTPIAGGGSSSDELVKITQFDTTADYLNNKLVAGTDISIDVLNEGANEQIRIAFVGSGGGATTFTGLTDTPNGYATFENQFVAVNSAGTQLEFVNAPGGGSLPTPPATGWFLMSDGNTQGDYNWYDNIRWIDGSIKLLNIGDYDTQGQYLQNGTPIGTRISAEVESSISTKYEQKYIDRLNVNTAPNQFSILNSFTDLTVGNTYTLYSSFFIKWKAEASGVPKLSYALKIQDVDEVKREVIYSDEMIVNEKSLEPYTFKYSFEANDSSLSIVLQTLSDQIDIAEGTVYAMTMELEEYNSAVRINTNEW